MGVVVDTGGSNKVAALGVVNDGGCERVGFGVDHAQIDHQQTLRIDLGVAGGIGNGVLPPRRHVISRLVIQ